MFVRALFTSTRAAVLRQIRMESTNISVSEVKKFSMDAAEWWDNKVLIRMNGVRVPFIRDNVKKTMGVDSLNNVSIIDVGCGGGILCEALARIGANVTGIDPSDKMIAVAEAHKCEDPNLKFNPSYQVSSLDEVACQNKKFDVAVASEVVEHVADLGDFSKKLAEVVKPGGSIFVTTMDRTNMSYWLAILMAEYVLRIVQPGTHDWELFVRPNELKNIFERYDVSLKSLQGISYYPLMDYWDYVSATDVNYMAHFVKAK